MSKPAQPSRSAGSRYRAANLLDWVMLGLLLAGIALFILYPIVSVVSTSFFVKGQFTLQYYLDLFTKSNLKLIGNSLWVATLSSSFTTFFAFASRCTPSAPKKRPVDSCRTACF